MQRAPWLFLLGLTACTNTADLGDPCTADADCEPDYVCHIEPDEAEGVCDECRHDDPDCDHDDHDDTGMTGM